MCDRSFSLKSAGKKKDWNEVVSLKTGIGNTIISAHVS